jgi:hypothetical protein
MVPLFMSKQFVLPAESIQEKIYLIRGNRVMLSHDLASLYDVEPRALIQAVKRNLERFPDDFMFQLSADEFRLLRSQIVILVRSGTRQASETIHWTRLLSREWQCYPLY